MYEIRWFAFVPALILAPILLAIPAVGILFVLSLWNAGIGPIGIVAMAAVVAVGGGAPTYLTFGAFAFWYALRRFGQSANLLAAGFAANILSAPVVLGFFLIVEPHDAWGSTAFIVGFGCIFAPIWSAIFEWQYWAMVGKGDALRKIAQEAQTPNTNH